MVERAERLGVPGILPRQPLAHDLGALLRTSRPGHSAETKPQVPWGMLSTRVLRPPAPEAVEIVRSLEAAAARKDGHESLGSFVWRDLADPSPESTGILALDDGQTGRLRPPRAERHARRSPSRRRARRRPRPPGRRGLSGVLLDAVAEAAGHARARRPLGERRERRARCDRQRRRLPPVQRAAPDAGAAAARGVAEVAAGT